jgi:Protein of unknown function (DUF1569)
MQLIYNTTENQAIIDRINQLKENSSGLWGKMTVSQMLVHCQQPLLFAEGKIEIKRSFIGLLLGKMFKNKFLKQDFGKNSPTDKKFIITNSPDFEKEKNELIKLIIRFKEKGTHFLVSTQHPFFGEMTLEEWGIMSYRHLDHHLRQFGV